MSSIDLAIRYLAERGRPRVLVPLALLLAGVGWLLAPAPRSTLPEVIATAANALLLIAAFRIWDDLEDRGRDAHEHPRRVMVTDGRTAPFVALAALVGAAGLVTVVLSPEPLARLAVLGGAVVILFIWYRYRGSAAGSVLGGHIVLIKYPAIAFALAPGLPQIDASLVAWRVAAPLASLYLLLCAYESFDDPNLRASRTARSIALTELTLLIPLIIATVSFSG